MSYSFNIRAANAAAAALACSAQLDQVCAAQPIHERDRAVADDTLAKLLALTAEPDEKHELSVSVSGSCYGLQDEAFEGISLTISIAKLLRT